MGNDENTVSIGTQGVLDAAASSLAALHTDKLVADAVVAAQAEEIRMLRSKLAEAETTIERLAHQQQAEQPPWTPEPIRSRAFSD